MNLLHLRRLAPARLTTAVAATAGAMATALAVPACALASELDLKIPVIDTSYSLFGSPISGRTLLLLGLAVCALGMAFGMTMFNRV